MSATPDGELRPAREDDLDWISALNARADVAAFVQIWPRERYAALADDPDAALLVFATSDSRGFAILRGLAGAARSIEVVRLAVETPGAGVGRRFLAALRAYAFETLGAARLWLDVYPDNARGRAAYARAGFHQIDYRRDAFRRSDGRLTDSIVLAIDAPERDGGTSG